MEKTEQRENTTAEWLLGQIEAFLDLNDMDANGCNLGWYVMRDRSLVTRLRDGGDLTTRKMELVLAFIQNPVDYRGKKLTLTPLNVKRRELP